MRREPPASVGGITEAGRSKLVSINGLSGIGLIIKLKRVMKTVGGRIKWVSINGLCGIGPIIKLKRVMKTIGVVQQPKKRTCACDQTENKRLTDTVLPGSKPAQQNKQYGKRQQVPAIVAGQRSKESC